VRRYGAASGGASPSSQIPAPQKARWAQLGSVETISVQAVPVQRFFRSFS
jgi:hypothetical protein